MEKQKAKRVVVVILNYLNYSETDECVESVLNQDYPNYYILLVDNGSDNKSYQHFQKKYHKNKKVYIMKTGKNYGFAKGNNIGIRYAKTRLQAEYVMLLNSDTVLCEESYISQMVKSDAKGIGVIGSKIIGPGDKISRKMRRYVTFPATLFFYLAMVFEYKNHPVYQAFWEQKLGRYRETYILKGCILLLTPTYFQYYEGLDPRTFLYCEEELLYLRCKKKGIKEKVNDSTYLFHKCGQSSKLLYGNEQYVYLGYKIASYKFVLLESMKMLICNFLKSHN